MAERDREWLRQFLRLDARTGVMTVPARDVARQEDTVLRALRMLDEQPGVVLADEVGMGKTYEALGVIAARHREDPGRRTLVLTPGPDLNEKWAKEFRAFCDRTGGRQPMYEGFAGRYAAARTLRELLQQSSAHPIVIAPVSMFAGGRAMRDNAYLLSLYFRWKGLRGNQSAAAFARYRGGVLQHVDVTRAQLYDEVPWDRIEPVLHDAITGHGNRTAEIDRLFEERRYELFDRADHVDRALAELRFRLIGALIPPLDLLVVDEAHKLKNPDALRAVAVREGFAGRFSKALFLTATPFQLDVSELRQVLELFALASGAPADMARQADELLGHVRDYKAAYASFEQAWRRLDGVAVGDFEKIVAASPTLSAQVEDRGLETVLARARTLLELKRTRVEPGFRKWMIRSLREDKRTYRRAVRTRLRPEGGAGVPFLLYERFISELFRSKVRTHKAAVQINMVSSYGAAREGALLADEMKTGLGGDAEQYRQLLRTILDGVRDDGGAHPKLAFVLEDALAAGERREKTLIFCARLDTLSELKRQIETAWLDRLVARWRAVDPDATRESIFDTSEPDESRTRGRHSRFRDRIHRSQDLLYLALRERYLQTAVDLGELAIEHARDVAKLATELARRQRVTMSRAEHFDWALAKRCIESATARLAIERRVAVDDPASLAILASDEFVRFGFNHRPDELEHDDVGEHAPQWQVSESHVQIVASRSANLWTYLKGHLVDVPSDLRVRAIERLARYLTHSQVPFLVDVLSHAKQAGLDVNAVESAAMLRFIDAFWLTPAGRVWVELVRAFLRHVAELDEERQRELLDGVMSAGQFVRHTERGESRERLREAFNTPLFPMVLIANEVMQEGLDLHHQCARVVHHDLAWNPAQLEQRVGRIDRLGALIQRRRAKDAESKLDILLPLVTRTIDERLDRVVRSREKWLEFLLGATPDLDEYNLSEDPMPELPQSFADALRIDLGPGTAQLNRSIGD